MVAYQLLVRLRVRSFDAMERFERQAIAIMKAFGGELISAMETQRDPLGGGEEVHILQFPSKQAFLDYRADSRLLALRALREQGIESTTIQEVLRIKDYEP